MSCHRGLLGVSNGCMHLTVMVSQIIYEAGMTGLPRMMNVAFRCLEGPHE
jgi:hypothetical protein